MKIELSDIENQPRSFSESIELQADALDAVSIQSPVQVRLEGRILHTALGYLVEGKSFANGFLCCSRCLEEVPWSQDDTFSFLVQKHEDAPTQDEVGLEEEDLDVVFVEDSLLDLNDLAVEQVLLNLPMRVVCSETCNGLCPSCGGNRNIDGGCTCTTTEIDPRWEGLRDIKGR